MSYESPQKETLSMGHFFKNVGLMLTGGVMAGAMLSGFWLTQAGDRLLGAMAGLFNPAPAAPKADIQSLVVQQVRDASELTTAIYTMQAVVPASQDAKLGGFVIGSTKLLYIAHGQVQAGVDLSRLSTRDIQVIGNDVRVQLPPPRILDSKIDINRSRVYDYNRGVLGLGPDTAPDLQILAQQKALKSVVEAACNDGVLKRAGDRAKFVVTQLLSTAGYRQVTVEIQAPTIDACIASASEPAKTSQVFPTESNSEVPQLR